MNWILGKIVGNPLLILWIAAAAFAAGGVAGGAAAWTAQGWRLDAVQSKFDGFVATVKAQGVAAQKATAAQESRDKLNKEQTDAATKRDLDTLRADNQRLRNTRTRGSYVPVAASTPDSPDRACFDRPELGAALQRLDDEVSGLVEEGSEAAINLDSAKEWARRR